MGPADWILLAANALAAAMLLTAGLGKLVSPDPVRRALTEIVPGTVRTRTVVRGFALAETLAAVSLLVPAVRVPAAAGTSALGVCFVALGLRGRFGRSTEPCGCFGPSSRRPLGWANVGVGLALAAVYPLNARLAPGMDLADYQASGTLLTAVGAIALCLHVNRRLIVRLLWPTRGVPAGNEVP